MRVRLIFEGLTREKRKMFVLFGVERMKKQVYI